MGRYNPAYCGPVHGTHCGHDAPNGVGVLVLLAPYRAVEQKGELSADSARHCAHDGRAQCVGVIDREESLPHGAWCDRMEHSADLGNKVATRYAQI